MSKMRTKNTDTLNHEIKAANSIDGFLARNRDELLSQSLPEHLAALLERKSVTRADVVRNSLLDRKYAYQIFSGEKTPSRDKLIAIAFGLGLTLDETQAMLKLSVNRELYSRDERDALIMFTLERQGDIHEANDLLHSHGFDTLGAARFEAIHR